MPKQKFKKKARLTVTIAPDLNERIQELAEGRRGGVSGVVEDCVRSHLDSLSSAPDRMIPERAVDRDEVREVVKELLSPEVVSEAMKILHQKSEIGEEILRSRSKRKSKASA